MPSKTVIEAIKQATQQAMRADPNVIVMGEGVPDPTGIFGSTIWLQEEFGENRVFDMPVSENGLTGVLIGAAITGLKPIMTHQRIDFSLYAVEQIANNAACWHSMFGGNGGSVPLVIRSVVGRGWGQGNQHSRNFAGLYASIPGLKVVMPSNAYNAKGLLLRAIKDPGPVMFIENRWIHNLTSEVPDEMYEVPFEAKVVQEGDDLTIVSWSYDMCEVLKANRYLKEADVNAEIIDLQSLRPLDFATIRKSVKKTQKLLVVESSWKFNSIAGEILCSLRHDYMTGNRLCLPDCYAPSSPAFCEDYYIRASDIFKKAMQTNKLRFGSHPKYQELVDYESNLTFDIPDNSFRGPF